MSPLPVVKPWMKPLPWLLALSAGLLILVGFVVMAGRLEPEIRYFNRNVPLVCDPGEVTLIWPGDVDRVADGAVGCVDEEIVLERLGR